MNSGKLIGLAVAGMIVCSCQSDIYRIDGYAKTLKDGDTVWLAEVANPSHVISRAIVSEGKLAMSGTTAAPTFCMAYTSNAKTSGVTFLLEPETITLELSPVEHQSRVSGTILNNRWQALSDDIRRLGKQLIALAEDSTTTGQEAHLQKLSAIDSLHRKMSECITNVAKENADNPLGRYINENYKAPEFE